MVETQPMVLPTTLTIYDPPPANWLTDLVSWWNWKWWDQQNATWTALYWRAPIGIGPFGS